MRLSALPARELARFLSASQPEAGAFLNAVPKRAAFQLQTWALRVAVQRRLGLPLTEAALAVARTSRSGRKFDCYGDVAQNDGAEGHQTRGARQRTRDVL